MSGVFVSVWLDQNLFEDGKLAYGQEDIPAESLLFEIKYMEGLYLEFNYRKKKWLLNCSYNANRNNIFNYVEKFSKFKFIHLLLG